jgi:DNA-binding Lrp family transcriptional regulator
MDKIDEKILKNLMVDARLSARQLALKLGMSTVTILSRIKKLEKEKIIKGYTALIDHEKLGYDLTAIIEIIAKKDILDIEEKLSKIDNVCGVYDITGNTDTVIVAKFKERNELSAFVKSLSSMANVENTITHVVLNTAKEDLGISQDTLAQGEGSSSNLEYAMTTEESMMLFGGFAVVVVGIFLFLARDSILRRKTSYDKEEHESKKDKTYEKYHSDWTDDYVDFTYTKFTEDDAEFSKAAKNSTLPDYYKILGLPRSASPDEIKKKYRELAKKLHPDKSKGEKTDETMAEINKAYEILSQKERKEKYDKHLSVD